MPCFELLSLHWQQSFWSAPASRRMMRSHVGAVAAVTGVEEAFMEAPLASAAEPSAFVAERLPSAAAVTALPVVDTPVEDMQLRDAAMDTAAMAGR